MQMAIFTARVQLAAAPVTPDLSSSGSPAIGQSGSEVAH